MDKKKKYLSLKSIPFGGNALRLSFREMLAVIPVALVIAFWGLPYLYGKWEKFNFGDDFRISYNLRDDYWSYQKWVEYAAENYDVLFVGDSVIWGMYTDNDHTLSAHYNRFHGEAEAANLGIDGLHPVALEGLMRDFGRAVKNRKVYLYFNALWLNDPKFDLSAMPQKDSEGDLEKITVMHPRLVPQFDETLYCYTEPFKKRMSNAMERNVPLFSVLNHLRNVWYDNQPLPNWMLAHPDREPLSAVGKNVDALEREHINRTDAWNDPRGFEVSYSWVPLYRSRQWEAFVRTAELLKERGNDVTVLLGAFNTHMLEEESLDAYEELMDDARDRLDDLGIKYLAIDELPSETYADASHPLDPGYKIMAEQITESEDNADD